MQDWLSLFLQLQDHRLQGERLFYLQFLFLAQKTFPSLNDFAFPTTLDIKTFVFYCFISSLKGLNITVVITVNRLVLCTFTKVRQCPSRKFGIVFMEDDRS